LLQNPANRSILARLHQQAKNALGEHLLNEALTADPLAETPLTPQAADHRDFIESLEA
jgi:hypothetical protein